MSKNINTLKLKLAYKPSKKAHQNYFEHVFPFFQRKNENTISYIVFNNYFSLCSFITNKIYTLFSRLREPELKEINREVCIEGFTLLFLSNLQIRTKTIFKLLDFDNDGYINIEDAKLLCSHFHYLTNKTDVQTVYEMINDFFNLGKDKKNEMNLILFEDICSKQNSDFVFLLIFYLFMNKPFKEEEIIYYENHINKNSEFEFPSLNLLESYKESFDLYFAEPSEKLFDYFNENYKTNLEYLILLNKAEDEKALSELIALESEISKVKNETMDLENKSMKSDNISNNDTLPNTPQPRMCSSNQYLSIE